MVIFGFDLASLFKAPKVTVEPEIPEPQEPMPVEYNEIDTNAACTVKVDEPSASSMVESDGELIVTPATSSSVTVMGPSVPPMVTPL